MASAESFPSLLRRRQVGRTSSRHVYSKKCLVDRLWLDNELDGHEGCVNCIEWNQDGTLLASGSDDRTVKIWDPHQGKLLTDLASGHREIIFSVKFLPHSGDRLVASGGTDCQVRLHDTSVSETVEVWDCHRSRVKRLAVAHDQPHLLWSGSEDGTVGQLDLRTSHRRCGSNDTCPNALIKPQLSVKCIAINPVWTHLLAVGFMDRVVRVYDLRRLDDKSAVMYFAPGAVFNRTPSPFSTIAVTYVSWSADGRKLLANYSGDQVYLFDIKESPVILHRDDAFTVPSLPANLHSHPFVASRQAEHRTAQELATVRQLQDKLASVPDSSLSAIVGECWSSVRRMPQLPELHNELRKSLLKRRWRGDVYAALRAARMQAAVHPQSTSAAIRVLEAYTTLRWWDQAKQCLQDLKERFQCAELHPEFQELADSIKGKPKPRGSSVPRSTPLDGVHDSEAHFCGHFNRLTDIKEANFLDKDCRYVVAGSDDRMIYVWEVESTRLVRAMLGDSEVVNCCQPHPDQLFLATSGIDNTIRLWSPQDMESAIMRDGDLQVGAELEERAANNHQSHVEGGPRIFALGNILVMPGELDM